MRPRTPQKLRDWATCLLKMPTIGAWAIYRSGPFRGTTPRQRANWPFVGARCTDSVKRLALLLCRLSLFGIINVPTPIEMGPQHCFWPSVGGTSSVIIQIFDLCVPNDGRHYRRSYTVSRRTPVTLHLASQIPRLPKLPHQTQLRQLIAVVAKYSLVSKFANRLSKA
jgi:hypothetical protein